MRNFFLLLFLHAGICLHAQADTLELTGTWDKLRFNTTTILESQSIIGKPKDTPTDQTMTRMGTDSVTKKFYSTQNYYYRSYIDSLKTIFQFSSRDTNHKDFRTLKRIELYGRCKVKINGSVMIDKSKRAEVRKIFGVGSATGESPGMELTFERYRLYVNNAWCTVEFFYDGGGTLRKVFIEMIE